VCRDSNTFSKLYSTQRFQYIQQIIQYAAIPIHSANYTVRSDSSTLIKLYSTQRFQYIQQIIQYAAIPIHSANTVGSASNIFIKLYAIKLSALSGKFQFRRRLVFQGFCSIEVLLKLLNTYVTLTNVKRIFCW
jgi:hypothetical protein